MPDKKPLKPTKDTISKWAITGLRAYFSAMLLLPFLVPSSAGSAIMEADVVTKIEGLINSDRARAIAVGVYENRETRVMGFGRLNAGNDIVPGGDTIFEIGSVTKVFTSLLVQTQVDADRLDWDDAIAKHLPDLEFASDAVASITLRELSSHTSGLPRLPDNMDPVDPLDPYKGYDRNLLLALIGNFKPASLDKSYEYSNLGVGLLGTIAADAVGLDYGQALQKEVFKPLELSDTSVQLEVEQQPRLAQGFSMGADMPNWKGFDALAGAGALLSTADDMLAFVQHYFEPNALSKPLAAILEPQADGDTAHGWHIYNEDKNGEVYWHNGGTGGYASFLAVRPDTRTGVVILSASTQYNDITELGFALLSGEEPVATTGDLEPYLGVYRLPDEFELSVFKEGDALFAQATGQGAFPLTSISDHEFEYTAAGIRIVFDRRSGDPAKSLTLFQGGKETPAPRVRNFEGPMHFEEIEADVSRLPDYVGEYQLAPGQVLTVLLRNRQLYAQLTGQLAYPVFAYETDRFFFKIVDAQLHFERDDNGVSAVVLH